VSAQQLLGSSRIAEDCPCHIGNDDLVRRELSPELAGNLLGIAGIDLAGKPDDYRAGQAFHASHGRRP
jgi:hypothetical protein